MLAKWMCGLTLAALVFAGPSVASDVGAAVQIDCAQWTAPIKLAGKTATSGPYATKAAALAALAQQQTQVNAIADTFWPFFSCPGCPDGVPGCDAALQVIVATAVTAQVYQGAGGWYIDYNFTGGMVSMSCDDCPEVPIG